MRRAASQDVKSFYRPLSAHGDGRLAGLSRVPPSPTKRDIARIREPDTFEPGSELIENELVYGASGRTERVLPLPPFMQGASSLKQRLLTRPAAQPSLYSARNKKSLAQNLRDAPFSTAFNLNPYAKALSVPVRRCSLTRVRLPHSCLLSFHPVTSEEEDRQSHELLPLSLAAELVPRNKSHHSRTEEEIMVTEEWAQESRSKWPTGIASYLLNSKSALHFATQQSTKKKTLIVTENLSQRLGKAALNDVKWRGDMPDFVLAAIQRLVMKKLRFIFNSKTSLMLDKPGMISEPPGGKDLGRLRDVDGVACVLRLKDEPIAEEIKDESAQQHENADEQSPSENSSQEELTPFSAFSGVDVTPEGEPLTSFRYKDNPNKKRALKLEREQTKGGLKKGGQFNPKSKEGMTGNPTDINETGGLNLRPSGKQQARQTLYDYPNEEQESQISVKIDSHASDQAYWAVKEEEGLSLSLVKPQQGSQRQTPEFFETVHYRNRYVPLYNLPRLLGKEKVQSLLEKSAFKHSKWVVLAYSAGTVDAQMWLLKLQAYVAEGTAQQKTS